MDTAPEVQSRTSDTITLRWPSWHQYISEEISLYYDVQYKEWNTWDWVIAGEVPNNSKQNYTDYLVENLRLNTRYKFRVLPHLEGTEVETIKHSPALGWTKTHCDGKLFVTYTRLLARNEIVAFQFEDF